MTAVLWPEGAACYISISSVSKTASRVPPATTTSVTDSASRGVSYVYDGSSNLTSYTDPESNVWTYGYDGQNQVVSVTDPKLNTFGYTYDGNNNLTRVTAPLGYLAHTDFDTEHYPIRTTVYPATGQSVFTQKNTPEI